ncbi:MAG TPA: hypothetical protein VHU41_17965, partial [Thermoanaerobaculia bacterium]|nr:hypothetical protein [Thermoanaerobaculia bacterium]
WRSAEDLEPDLWGRLMPDDTVNDYWGAVVPVQSNAEAAYQDQLYRNWLTQRKQTHNYFGMQG